MYRYDSIINLSFKNIVMKCKVIPYEGCEKVVKPTLPNLPVLFFSSLQPPQVE